MPSEHGDATLRPLCRAARAHRDVTTQGHVQPLGGGADNADDPPTRFWIRLFIPPEPKPKLDEFDVNQYKPDSCNSQWC